MDRSTLRRRNVAFITTTTLALAWLISGSAGSATASESTSAPASAVAASTAPTEPGAAELQEAAQTGYPVEVQSETTETSQVMALPDGTLQLSASRGPVRARTADGWADIDTRLSDSGDGYEPAVTTTPTRFGDGGDDLVAMVGTTDSGVELHWESVLPAPVVAAEQATYRNVRPDVDLVVTATSTGYSKALVVKTPAAAADLAGHPASLTVITHGTNLVSHADGALEAVDTTGQVAFAAPPAVIWDSSGTDPAVDPDAQDPADGKVRPVPVTTDTTGNTTQVQLKVPAEVLSDPSTMYPLYLDPSIGTKTRTAFMTVHSGGWDYYNDTSEPMRVGYCGWSGCTSSQGNSRSFIVFDTSALTGKATTAHIYSASVKAYQIHNSTSAAQPVNLTKATDFSSATNYPGPVSTTLQQVSSACDSSSPCYLTFNNSSVVSYLQSAANVDETRLNFSLSAPAENDRDYWKKFDSAAGSTVLNVIYDYPPSTPAAPTVVGDVTCTGYSLVHDTTPTFQSSATTYAGTQVRLTFQVYTDPAGASPVVSGSATGSSGSTLTSPAMAALPQGRYSVRVYAESVSTETGTTDLKSGYSSQVYFTVDTNPPAATSQQISSAAYPREYWGAAQTTPGVLNVKAATDAVAVAYSIDSQSAPNPTDTTCTYTSTNGLTGLRPVTSGAASFTPPNTLTAGRHTLNIRSFDAAHNVSSSYTTYAFYVSPTFSGNPGQNLIEAETASPKATTADTYVYTLVYPGASGGKNAHLVSNGPGKTFTYTLNAPISAYYALGVLLQTQYHYGAVRFQLDDQDLLDKDGAPIVANTYSAALGSLYRQLGGYQLDAGPHVLKVITVPTSSVTSYTYNGNWGVEQVAINNYSDNGNSVVVDAFTMAPIRNQFSGNLQGSFNNKGISTDGSTSADLTMTKTNTALSKTALSTAGFTQGATVSIDQAFPFTGSVAFTVPLPTAQGDNTVAAGQTISLQKPDGTYPKPASTDWQNPGYINLLVSSTCGATMPASNGSGLRALSILMTTQTGTKSLEPLITKVPDWRSAAPADLGGLGGKLTTDHVNQGVTALTGQTGTLYVMKFPIGEADWNEVAGTWSSELRSITLPRVGTDFTESCSTSALHVFALNITAN